MKSDAALPSCEDFLSFKIFLTISKLSNIPTHHWELSKEWEFPGLQSVLQTVCSIRESEPARSSRRPVLHFVLSKLYSNLHPRENLLIFLLTFYLDLGASIQDLRIYVRE